MAAGCAGEIDNIPTTPDPVIVTDTFTGTMNINGAATHNVFTSATGHGDGDLTSLGENAPAKVGFSMGTLSTVGTCTVVVCITTTPWSTRSLTGTVATLNGSLCVRVLRRRRDDRAGRLHLTVTHP